MAGSKKIYRVYSFWVSEKTGEPMATRSHLVTKSQAGIIADNVRTRLIIKGVDSRTISIITLEDKER